LGFQDDTAPLGQGELDPTANADRAQITAAEQPQPGGTEPRTPQSDDKKLADKVARLGFEEEDAQVVGNEAESKPGGIGGKLAAMLPGEGDEGIPLYSPAPQGPELSPEQEEAKRKLDGFTSALLADYILINKFNVGELPDHLKLENIRYTYDQYLAGIQDGTITIEDIADLVFGRAGAAGAGRHNTRAYIRR